eukprot:jgi/Psemu1/569/gm1.569_g
MEYPSDRQQRQRQQQRSACPPYSQQHWFPIQQPQPQSVSPSLPWPAPFGLRTVPEESSTDVDRSPLVSGGGGGGGVADVAVSCSYPKRGRCVILGPSRSDSDANGVSNSSSSSSMDCSDDDNHEDEPFIPTCKRRRLWAPPLPNPGESNNNSAVRHPFPEPNILLWEDSRFEPHHAPACSSNHNKNDNDNKNSNNNTNHNHHTEARELLPWWKKKQKPQRRILVEQDDDDDDECMEDPNERGGRSNSASAVCCHVCCGSFVPPPAPAVRSVMPANALLRYVSVSVNGGNGADTDTVRGCGSGFLPRSSPSASPAGCPSCDRPTCPECWNRCGVCQRDFCSFCTVSHHRSASVSGMVCADCG